MPGIGFERQLCASTLTLCQPGRVEDLPSLTQHVFNRPANPSMHPGCQDASPGSSICESGGIRRIHRFNALDLRTPRGLLPEYPPLCQGAHRSASNVGAPKNWRTDVAAPDDSQPDRHRISSPPKVSVPRTPAPRSVRLERSPPSLVASTWPVEERPVEPLGHRDDVDARLIEQRYQLVGPFAERHGAPACASATSILANGSGDSSLCLLDIHSVVRVAGSGSDQSSDGGSSPTYRSHVGLMAQCP